MNQNATEYPLLPPSHPFNEFLGRLAEDMKAAGLTWTPRVGDFVLDSYNVIHHPSPFPDNIYFILNINRFLEIFKTPQNMVEKLTWMPTWHQAREICRLLKIDDAVVKEKLLQDTDFAPENDLRRMYQIILSSLNA